MEYLVSIIKTSHLIIYFSFHNPEHSAETAYVPRLLEPLGYFITVEIFDQDNNQVYQTYCPKVKLKLHPSRSKSYQAIEPGYTYGIAIEIGDFTPKPGIYKVSINYSNKEFRGFTGNPLGEMTYQTSHFLKID